MRALLLTWDYPPAKGGIQIWMLELARGVPGIEMTVLAPSAPGDREFDRASGVDVRRVPGGERGQASWLAGLIARTLAVCVTRRPDVIVCGHVVATPAALVARRLLGIPYVVLTHAWEIRRKRRRLIVGHMLREAAMVTANSRFTTASVLMHAVKPERVRLLPPGTDPERFTPATNGRRSDSPKGGGTILTVARLDELYKGHDTVIRSLPLIKAQCPGARYVVAGDGRLRHYLTRLAQSLGLEHDVVFLGKVSDEVLPQLYRSASVLVQMSREALSGGGAEGFGIVCLEASACEVPVVAGRSGGLPDAVLDGVTGLLVDPDDHGEVADAVVSVLSDPDLGARLGRAGRERVVAELTWAHMARRARALFAEAAAGGKPETP